MASDRRGYYISNPSSNWCGAEKKLFYFKIFAAERNHLQHHLKDNTLNRFTGPRNFPDTKNNFSQNFPLFFGKTSN
jgi:hypothetical protein